MKWSKKIQTEEEKIADCQKNLLDTLIRMKREIIVAAVLGAIYLLLSIWNSSEENYCIVFTFAFFPFLWMLQGWILHEFKKDSPHVKKLRLILIPYLLLLIVCAVVMCYSAIAYGVHFPQGIIQVCILIHICLHVFVAIIALYTLWLRASRISLILSAVFGVLAMVLIPILQVICGLTGIAFIFMCVFSFFDPFYFYYAAAVLFVGPMVALTFVFIYVSEIRLSSETLAQWRASFPNYVNPDADMNFLSKTTEEIDKDD